MDLRTQRDVSTGFGDGLAQAFELVVTPAIFCGLGYLVDRAVGTVPVFTLLFGFVVLGYMVWKLVSTYSADMEKAQADKPWNRRPAQEASHG